MTKVVVAAAVIECDERVLVTRRQEGTHLAGFWEFPGGKCVPGESLHACMVRELYEELRVDAMVGEELLVTTYDYAERRVELHFLRCDLLSDPVPQLGQQMRWVSRQELDTLELPPADEELVEILLGKFDRK